MKKYKKLLNFEKLPIHNLIGDQITILREIADQISDQLDLIADRSNGMDSFDHDQSLLNMITSRIDMFDQDYPITDCRWIQISKTMNIDDRIGPLPLLSCSLLPKFERFHQLIDLDRSISVFSSPKLLAFHLTFHFCPA